MNRYLIEHKIKTLSHLGAGLNDGKNKPEMRIYDYIFSQWDFNYSEGWKGDAWLVKKEILSDSGINAINRFRGELDKITQKIAFISQCYMDFYREPFLLYKTENNQDRIFFYKHIQERKGVGLQFNKEELNDYEKIKRFKYPEAFRFLQESCNTIGYIPKLLLLFSTLEALCGKIEKENDDGKTYITYDKSEMKKILGFDLYNEVFGPKGIRHKLNHGELVDFVFGKNYVNEIYKSIVCYFNTNFNTKIKRDIISPQRHFYDNYQFINFWLKPKKDFFLNLKNCINSFNLKNNTVNGCEYFSKLDFSKY